MSSLPDIIIFSLRLCHHYLQMTLSSFLPFDCVIAVVPDDIHITIILCYYSKMCYLFVLPIIILATIILVSGHIFHRQDHLAYKHQSDTDVNHSLLYSLIHLDFPWSVFSPGSLNQLEKDLKTGNIYLVDVTTLLLLVTGIDIR